MTKLKKYLNYYFSIVFGIIDFSVGRIHKMFNYVLFAIFIILISLFSSCKKDNVNPQGSSGLQFLVASPGSTSIKTGLHVFNPAENTYQFVSPFYPHGFSDAYLDYKNGRIVFTTDVAPNDSSCIAYVDVNNWNGLRFAPRPSAPIDYYYAVPKHVKPKILNDGKIVYKVVLNTDNQFDDFHIGDLAIYDSKTNKIELTGDPSVFIKSQPEIGSDTEGGSVGDEFLVTPDNKYIYLSVYGYGTSTGQYHIDNWFIARYEIGKPGSYTRIAYIGHGSSPDQFINVITGDGKYITTLSGNKINLETKVMSIFDNEGFGASVGAYSPSSSKMLKVWRCGGIAYFDLNSVPEQKFVVIDPSKLSGSYRGLGHGVQFSKDESKIYFTGSTDYCINYDGPIRIYSSPLVEMNATPDSISTLPIEYCTSVFQLLGK